MNILKPILLFAFTIFLFSCEKEPATIEETSGIEWELGKNEYNIEIDGVERNFVIHVPQNYSEEIKVPIVMMLHGSTGDGAQFHRISRWPEKSEEEGFIAIFPTALAYKIKDTNKTSTKWSSGGLEEDLEEGTVIKDDIPFIEGMIALCQKTFKIDSKRLYICGFSNGGGFVKSQVLPNLGHLFAACSASGGIGHPISFEINGNRMLPFYNITGSLDDRILEKLGPQVNEIPLEGADLMDIDIIRDQINYTTSALKLTNNYMENRVQPKYNTLTFNEGMSGEANEYVLTIVNGLEHKYPNEINNPNKVIAANLLWEWFEKWSL